MFPASMPNSIRIDAPNGNGLLDAAGNYKTVFLTLVGSQQGFNQSRHAPFSPGRHSRSFLIQSAGAWHKEFET